MLFIKLNYLPAPYHEESPENLIGVVPEPGTSAAAFTAAC